MILIYNALATNKQDPFLFGWELVGFFSSPLSSQHSNYLTTEDILSGKESEFIDRNLYFFSWLNRWKI